VHASKIELGIEYSPDNSYDIRLQVHSASLVDVLDEISQKTGVKIHHSVLPSKIITATCVANKMELLFQCLLGKKVDLVFYYAVKATTENFFLPLDIWLLGSTWGNQSASSHNEDARCAEKLETAGGNNGSELEQQDDFDALFKKARLAVSSQKRLAINQLSEKMPKNMWLMTELLRDALTDADAGVRAEAVSAWVNRKEDSADIILQNALHDEAVEVKMMAVDLAKTHVLLGIALADEEQIVRDFAKRKISNLNDE